MNMILSCSEVLGFLTCVFKIIIFLVGKLSSKGKSANILLGFRCGTTSARPTRLTSSSGRSTPTSTGTMCPARTTAHARVHKRRTNTEEKAKAVAAVWRGLISFNSMPRYRSSTRIM